MSGGGRDVPYFAVKLLYFAVKHCEPTVLHSIFTVNSEGHGDPPWGSEIDVCNKTNSE